MRPIINKKARYNFYLLEEFEAGLVLTGNEIKQVRAGKGSLDEAFVQVRNGEAYLVNTHIAPYEKAGFGSEEAKRSRKLLLHKKEIDYLIGRLSGTNLTLIPTRLYLKRNYAKIGVALAKGKKKYDKREAIKKREEQREAQSLLRKAKLAAQKQSKN